MKRFLLTLAFVCFAVHAEAATCFWVGGTGNWNDATHWASSTGGAGSSCAATSNIPKNAGDIATLDANSTGTTTMDIDVSIAQITSGAHAGTLVDSAHNVTLSTSWSCSGTGTRTATLTGTWTFTGSGASANPIDCTTMTNMTLTATSATFVFTATTTFERSIIFGAAASLGTVTLNANTGGRDVLFFGPSSATLTIGTLNVIGPNVLSFLGNNSRVYALTNGFSFTGTSSSIITLMVSNQGATPPTITSANAMTCSWCAIGPLFFAGGGNVTATNAFDLGGSTISGGGTKSITAPVVGGGGIIGG